MATIRTTIQVQDRMSQAFRSMNSAMQTVIGSFEHLQRTSSNAVDTAAIQAARRELALAESAFNDIEQEIRQSEQEQRRLNDSIDNGTDLANNLLKTVIGIASAYGAFSWLKSGFDRLMSIDTATAKLQALGHNAQSVEMIMNDSLNSVRGTAFGLDEAVNTAASAVAAGIKPGQQLERYLSLTADAAALAGTNMSDMGAIFNKVTTSGKIQAEELNQISDRGIPIFQMLADEIGVTATEIRKLASDGKISANTFLNAVESGFGGAAQIMGTASFQATLDNISSSISRIAANFLNGAGEGQGFFDQVKPLMVDLLETLKQFEDKAIVLGQIVGQVFMYIYNILSSIASVIIENWTFIAPLVYFIAGAFGALTFALIATKVAQWNLNMAILSSPLFWIPTAIMAIIAVIHWAIEAYNKFAGTSISATGAIVGVLLAAGSIIANVFIYIWNVAVEVFTTLYNIAASITEGLVNLFSGDLSAIGRMFVQLGDNVLGILESIAKGIDYVFGKNLAGAVSGWRNGLQKWATENLGENKVKIDRMVAADYQLKTFDTPKAFETGYNWGANLGVGFKDIKAPKLDPSKGIQEQLSGMEGIKDAVKNTGKSGKDTAGNTKKMAESMDMAEEDLKYLRDLAEREVINRFTTAEIKVDMSGMSNNINNEMDLDGVVSYLEEKVYETMTIAAEGDHD